MKYIKYKISLILVLSLSISSCSDWLEMEPINQTYGAGFWISEAAANQALAGGYALLRISLLDGNRFHTYGEYIEQRTTRTRAQSEEQKFQDMSFWNPNFGPFQWHNFFKTVAQANMVLEEVEKMNPDLFADGEEGKNKILGEAYFLRAYTYFWMVRVWGGVPLVLEATRTVSQYITSDGRVINIGRTPEQEVLQQCLADLAIAETYLDYGTPGNSQWSVRANRGSVQAVQAHIYLWMGDAEKSQQAAEAVIADGGYNLVDYTNETAVQNMFRGRSSEGIFELNVDYDQSESYANNGMAHRTLIHPYILDRLETQINLLYMWKEGMLPLYEEDDLRLNLFYDYLDRERPIILKYAGIQYEDEALRLHPHATNNILLHRLSEIILLRAEALNKLGRYNEARTLLNTIRTRANATPFTGPDSELTLEIFYERKRELIGEGHTYFDRIRGNLWQDISWMTAERIAAQGYYWPVAGNFIINNPLISQNPWWATKTW